MADFLLEIGTEEIPDYMIEPALADLRAKFEAAFGIFGGSALILDATPRRLVLRATGLSARAPDAENVALGPYLSAGTKAAEGFAKKWGSRIDQLKTTQDAKGERYVISEFVKGQSAREGLAEKLPGIIASIQFPKSMSWPGSQGVRFIRPIRWILALLDDVPVDFMLAGIASGTTTRGHRILGSKDAIPVTIGTYEDALRKNGVLVKAEERRQRITSQLDDGVQKDDDLLATLIYLTEFPSVVRGNFDPAYLELPQEILSTVMRHHQRYFSVVDERGSLRPEFVGVTNTDGDPDGLIRQGNERVLRARFNDARFFWQTDQRKTLADRIPDLENVMFHAKLGSYGAKTTRVTELGTRLAGQVGADLAVVARACLLAKNDLTTDMVKEFTELQGIVGGLYARAQGEDERVAMAIYDHYKPVSMEDAIPRTIEGQIVSIADKLDTLRECFHVRMIPTGSKDPFALRRAAQGIVKILFEARLPLAPMNLVDDVPELPAFLKERVQYYLREVRGYAYDEVNAVLSAGLSTLHDAADRIEAIHYIRPTNDFEPVAASFKRIKNILKQAQVSATGEPDPKLLSAGPEQELYRAFERVRSRISSTNGYRSKLEAMASLRPQVDLFFDKILVNDSNPAIRRNRLALLNCLLTEFSNIADFSEIVTQGGI
jgi:glycyl-tRNA synthetase beta chain